MDLTPQLILGFANFGVSAMFAVILLGLYSRQTASVSAMSERWTERLVDLTEKTVTALNSVQSAIVTLQSAVTSLCEEVRQDRRDRDRRKE